LRQSNLLAALDPFDYRPFQHIDEGVRIVPMDVLHRSGRILTVSINISFPAPAFENLPRRHQREAGVEADVRGFDFDFGARIRAPDDW
jgi:hypothetical protein